MTTEKDLLILKIKAFQKDQQFINRGFFKGLVALRCVCGCDVYGSVYYPDAFRYVREFLDELASGERVDDELQKALNRWFRLPATL